MNYLSVAAVVGLTGVLIGVVLVNVVSTPDAAMVGGIIAAIGVVALVIVAIGHLVS